MKYTLQLLNKELKNIEGKERTTLAKLEVVRDDDAHKELIDELNDITDIKNELRMSIELVEDWFYGFSIEEGD